ncbi:MAG: hydroxymethylpyrimidine/phosphomethylpyrimidine kinase [Vicingaceae bacterium]
MKNRPKILTIAGFDPSGGAGLLADVKTIEANKCAAFAVCTANTVQNENEFVAVNWIAEEEVFAQLDILLKEHQFKYVKVGLIPSLDFLKKIIANLQSSISNVKIVWDSVLSASAGFDLGYDLSALKEVLKGIYIVTPNWNEIKQLSGNDDAQKGAELLAELTNVYLKGGHNPTTKGKDYFYFEGQVLSFNPKIKVLYDKHGSGCVFSSVLTANLAKDYPIIKACLRSKAYMYKFLNSSPTLLGTHRL